MLPRLLNILKHKGYQVYQKPYQLNLIGIRSPETKANAFDDEMRVIFKDDQGKWWNVTYTITTDPGTYWLLHPMQVEGTGLLKLGQYVDAYQIGLHRGQYKALTEVKPVTVIRDYDRNAILDFNNGKESTGYFGINIHHASMTGTTKYVGKWSAGCQVFQKISEFNQFMQLCDIHRERYGNRFTYTLIDLRMLFRRKVRHVAYAASAALVLGTTLWFYAKQHHHQAS